ncbi:hypothetical protein Ait01nite_073710 [Actinoplanes italicus]|uniref:Uncharacterized protein n=1 Tax=Actinoplanes italicus TaxID=113567 RepID=A0A2T0K0D8_9ACTN|nr:hypothetical protein [Actinoplanes italicus]PRX16251.1 hypothetical protein CLV67_12066 [Actinoplanes italicus]GIE34326.1 hypothetical protein Ait01nite_073710 [Actinoplanes italicus]
MHDEMLALFDDCIARMLDLRGDLAATRRVHPGERHSTVLTAIEVASHFASEAGRTVTAGVPAGTPAGLPGGLSSGPPGALPVAFPAAFPAAPDPTVIPGRTAGGAHDQGLAAAV